MVDVPDQCGSYNGEKFSWTGLTVVNSDAIQSGFIPRLRIVIEVFTIVRPIWVAFLNTGGKFLPFVTLKIE